MLIAVVWLVELLFGAVYSPSYKETAWVSRGSLGFAVAVIMVYMGLWLGRRWRLQSG